MGKVAWLVYDKVDKSYDIYFNYPEHYEWDREKTITKYIMIEIKEWED